MAEKKTEDMSPEEIAKLQKENCVFCKIISGEIPSQKVHEDDLCIGILDINPATQGHILLLPKEHYAIMPLMPDDLLKHMSQVSQNISNALLSALGVQGTTVFIANGQYAGQKAPHVMIHVVPRFKSDKLSNFSLPKHQLDSEKVAQLAQTLHQNMAKMLADRIKQHTPQDSKAPAQQPDDTETQERMQEQVKENLRNIMQQEEQLRTLLKDDPKQFIELIQSSPTMRETLEKIDIQTVARELQQELKQEDGEVDSSPSEEQSEDKTDQSLEASVTDSTDESETKPQQQGQDTDHHDEPPEQEKEADTQQSDNEETDSTKTNLDDIANLFS